MLVPLISDGHLAWGGRLFLAPGMFLYLGAGASADSHAHHAVQLVWAKDRELTLQLPTGIRQFRAALVPASVEHALEATDQTVALLLVEPHGVRGAGLDAQAKELVGIDIAPRLAALSFPSNDIGGDEALAWCEALLNVLAPTGRAAAVSRATARAIDHVEAGLGGVPRLAEAARLVGLSPTRLTHQFSAEVGIPFRRSVDKGLEDLAACCPPEAPASIAPEPPGRRPRTCAPPLAGSRGPR